MWTADAESLCKREVLVNGACVCALDRLIQAVREFDPLFRMKARY